MSVAAAAELYGVVIDLQTCEIDVAATGRLRAARQAKTAPGNLAVSLLADSNFAFWTRTLWNDQDAMRAFMLSGAHRRMMRFVERALVDFFLDAAVVLRQEAA